MIIGCVVYGFQYGLGVRGLWVSMFDVFWVPFGVVLGGGFWPQVSILCVCVVNVPFGPYIHLAHVAGSHSPVSLENQAYLTTITKPITQFATIPVSLHKCDLVIYIFHFTNPKPFNTVEVFNHFKS